MCSKLHISKVTKTDLGPGLVCLIPKLVPTSSPVKTGEVSRVRSLDGAALGSAVSPLPQALPRNAVFSSTGLHYMIFRNPGKNFPE